MENTIQKTKSWVEKMVIGQQLCPFAKVPFEKDKINYRVEKENSLEKHLMAFWEELIFLENTPKEKTSNSLLIFPKNYPAFHDYLEIYYMAEELIFSEQKNELFQLASFHPKYQFAGTEFSDVTNYTNRSPFPMIHILRVEEVEAAIATYPDINSVPERNKKKLRNLGENGVRKIISNLNG